MRLKCSQLPANHHKDVVGAVCWAPFGELFTCSDDGSICHWSRAGDCLGVVCRIEDTTVTNIHWFPSVGNQISDLFAVSCTDGSFRIVSKTGREEKKVEASAIAALIALRWNLDGSALATAGEDGAVKVWSRSGMLRSTLATMAHPVYSVVWAPDNDQLLFSSGRELSIKSMQVDRKQLTWKAHDSVVMSVDWSMVSNLIVSGGEDCKYKVWDSLGRLLFQSSPSEHVITSVAWAPNGENFAVGSYDMVRVCDKAGWSFGREKPDTGSLLALSWSSDGTVVAGGGGSGAVMFAELIGTQLQWQNYEAVVMDTTRVAVTDVFGGTCEELEFRERVVCVALDHGHLVVATASQCSVYNVQSWNTPHIFDLRSAPNLVLLSERQLLVVDAVSGLQVYSYDGRLLSTPKFAGLRAETLSAQTVALGPDCVAIVDRTDGKTVRVFDVRTSHPVGKPLVHETEIAKISLSQHALGLPNRLLVFVDANSDLFVTPVLKHNVVKLQAMVDSFAWNDTTDMLTACADGSLITYLYPNAVFVDRTLLPHTVVTIRMPTLGKSPFITSFGGPRVNVRRSDGKQLTTTVATFGPMLYDFVSGSRWDEAVRLCRFVKQASLWGALACMALHANHLDTTETAFAALSLVDKLHYIMYIKDIPSAVARNAELALLKRNPDEAEKLLLQASPPLVYRAIKMNINLFRWGRALELAKTHKTHIDTVLGYRQRFLESVGRKENDPQFQSLFSSVKIDWDAIQKRKLADKQLISDGSSSDSRAKPFAPRSGGGGGGGGGGGSSRAAPGGARAASHFSDDVDGKRDDGEREDFKQGDLSD